LPFGAVPEDEIHERLLDGRAHLWCGRNSAAVTEITDDNILRIWMAGGNLREIMSRLPDVEAFAKAVGCVGVETEGRGGWLRVLSQHGYVYDGQRLIKSWL
jgi:hypothetical protein